MPRLYHSTRSNEHSVTSKQAILDGIASDGGLYISDSLLDLTINLEDACRRDYHGLARLILEALLPDFSPEEIARCVGAAYGPQFDTPAITPLVPVGDDWMLELWHGPTCAFKDVALQMLPQLMSCAREELSPATKIMIVTATSGDTGKAALEGFAQLPDMGVAVFYPHEGVSDIQRLQMVTQQGNNVSVCGIRGNFDDAQTEVKHIFADEKLAQRLHAKRLALSSANSINVGRLVPQVVYYFAAYKQLCEHRAIKLGDPVEFCVPTGNFGNVLAGYYAKQLGLPISRLIVASNINDVLVDLILSGVYNRLRSFNKSLSPSMDILVSSNLERLLYYLSDGDTTLVAKLMDRLERKGSYTLPSSLRSRVQELFCAGRATDEETQATIKQVWEHHHQLIDTHTAVALHVLQKQKRTQGVARVCLSTANPYKFPAAVLEALGQSSEGLDGFGCMHALQAYTHSPIPHPLAELHNLSVRHHDIVERTDMSSYVEASAERLLS